MDSCIRCSHPAFSHLKPDKGNICTVTDCDCWGYEPEPNT